MSDDVKKKDEIPDSTDQVKEPANIKLSPEDDKKLEYLITAPLRSADRLMKQLYKEDNFYQQTAYSWVGEKDAKKLFLYGVCKEVTKTCVGLMSDKEFLEEVPNEKNVDRTSKLVIGSISDVQKYRSRKMIELLMLLILFDRNTKRDEEYRIFHSAENLDLLLSRQEDFRDLYEGRIVSNTQHTIDDYAKRIQDDLKTIGQEEVWFLDKNKLEKMRPSVFKSKKKLYLAALLVANPDERLALGISYGRGYSRTSRSVHPLLGSHDYSVREKGAKKIFDNFSHLSIICMNINHLAYKLAGIDDPEGLAKIMGPNFEKSEASQAMMTLKKDFQLGDIVLTAWTDLAIIIDEHTSKYGYRAYKVRYISQPPLPEFPEDWLESQGILARLMTKGMVRGFYEKSAQSIAHDKEVAEVMKEILKLPEEQLMGYAEKTFLDFHKIGVLIPMLIESGFLKKKDAPEL